jgi:uncharacterized protein (DUF433 family)
MQQSLVGVGLYPVRQAARLVRAQPRTVRRWLRGYSWKYRDGRSYSGPLWRTQFARALVADTHRTADPDSFDVDETMLGFRDLLELRMVAQFVEHGVTLKVVRATIEEAEKTLGSYPLTNRKFLTDGRRIFLHALEEEEPRLLDILGKQFVFSEIIGPSLYEGIEYAPQDERRAARWYPIRRNRTVMLDPEVQFGAPILSESGVPTDALLLAWIAEGKDHAAVARAYEVPVDDVKAAVEFEQSLESDPA